jgi:hypothetical protein
MTKLILLVLLIFTFACSKKSEESSIGNLITQPNIIQYEEINMAFNAGILSSGSSFNYGDILQIKLLKLLKMEHYHHFVQLI